MPHKVPYPYQDEDSDRLADETLDAPKGLASDPGTGKTMTALLAAKKRKVRRILVVCPAVARAVWVREALPFDLWRVVRLDLPGKLDLSGDVIVIVGYEHLVSTSRMREAVMTVDEPFDVMICDEAHYLKNPAAKRTQFVYGELLSSGQVYDVWPLSGTFMLNHPGELWPHVNALDPERIGWMDYFTFTRLYCKFEQKRVGKSTYREQITGSNRDMSADLKERLTGLFVRREASVNNLPPLNFQMRPIDADLSDKALSGILDEDTDDNAAIRAALNSADPLAALKSVDAHLSRIRTTIAMAKVPGAVRIVRDIMEHSTDKVLVWLWHMDPFDKLLKELGAHYGVVSIRGDTTQKKREIAERDFQNDPACRIFVGQIQAAGTAITLTAGARELFIEEAFTPALNFQAAKRAHRIGQTRSVLCETLYIPDTLDEAITQLLNKKTAEINALAGAI